MGGSGRQTILHLTLSHLSDPETILVGMETIGNEADEKHEQIF